MPPPEGVNLGDFEVDDSNTGRDGHVAPHHRLEPWGPISSLPLSLCLASSPSKDWPKGCIPRHDVGSWTWQVTLCVDSRGCCFPSRYVA